tara:strand:- start:1279 stop:2082 length:804 start_codon:yes stop_codon:yes gene_type:complete
MSSHKTEKILKDLLIEHGYTVEKGVKNEGDLKCWDKEGNFGVIEVKKELSAFMASLTINNAFKRKEIKLQEFEGKKREPIHCSKINYGNKILAKASPYLKDAEERLQKSHICPHTNRLYISPENRFPGSKSAHDFLFIESTWEGVWKYYRDKGVDYLYIAHINKMIVINPEDPLGFYRGKDPTKFMLPMDLPVKNRFRSKSSYTNQCNCEEINFDSSKCNSITAKGSKSWVTKISASLASPTKVGKKLGHLPNFDTLIIFSQERLPA